MDTIKLGATGEQVKELQEWLNFHGISVVIDSEFGPATDHAVKRYQKLWKLESDGVVGPLTWDSLTLPIITLKKLPEMVGIINSIIYRNALRHYNVRAREIGGQNCGPFVRYYMNGSEGVSYPWCAGFVSTIILQSFAIAKLPVHKFKYRTSCDELYVDAQINNTLVTKPVIGGIFLVVNPNNKEDCTHTGIIVAADDKVITTVEGNTNDTGSREGYEVCMRYRAITNKYFINVGAQ